MRSLTNSAIVGGGAVGLCILLSKLTEFLNVRLLPPELRLERKGILAMQPWRAYREAAKTLGPVFSIRPNAVYMPWLAAVFGFLFPRPSHIVILDSEAAVTDLFQKRSEVFSDRPKNAMAALIGRQDNVGFTPYGARLRAARLLLHKELGPQSVGQWAHLMEETADRLMADWKSESECSGVPARNALRRNLESLIFRLTYGRDLTPEYLNLVKQVNAQTGAALQPGRWLINYWPFLAYVPTWMLGSYFKNWAQQAKALFVQMVKTPFDQVQADMRAGQEKASFVSNRLYNNDSDQPTDARLVMTTAGSVFSAGVDTLESLLLTLFTLLSHHPEIQEKAHAEIMGVISEGRNPSFEDQELLPSIQRIIMESLRFHPPVPILTHSPSRESMYNGWRIPKGSWVFANVWSIYNNEAQFAEPRTFKPERFLDPTLLDPNTFVFGAGRRGCPGIHLATMLGYLIVARTIATFRVGREGGVNDIADLEFDTGLVSAPKHFNCVFIPRS